MQAQHLKALEQRHEKLEECLHQEQCHAARDAARIDQLKKEKLLIKDMIEQEKRCH